MAFLTKSVAVDNLYKLNKTLQDLLLLRNNILNKNLIESHHLVVDDFSITARPKVLFLSCKMV